MHTGLKKRLAARHVPPILNRHVAHHPVLAVGPPMDRSRLVVRGQPVQPAADGYSNAIWPRAVHDTRTLQVT